MALDIARQLVGFWWIFFVVRAKLMGIFTYPRSQYLITAQQKNTDPIAMRQKCTLPQPLLLAPPYSIQALLAPRSNTYCHDFRCGSKTAPKRLETFSHESHGFGVFIRHSEQAPDAKP